MKIPRGLPRGGFNPLVAIDDIAQRIYTLRGVKIMLDRDLAELYEVQTKVLKRNVRRNISRFPQDSMFELTPDEFQHVRSQIEERFQVVFTVLDKLVSDENALNKKIGFIDNK